MATITLRLSAKTDKATSQHEILMRFRHGKIDQYGATNVFVQPEYWSDEQQSIVIPNWRTLTDEKKKIKKELQGKIERLAEVTSFVQTSFQELDKTDVAKDWLKSLINGYNFPTTDTAEAQEEQKQKSFFDWFELFLATKNYPQGSTKSFRVLERALGRYQGYKRSKDKKFILDVDTITKDTINDFFKYFKSQLNLSGCKLVVGA